MSNLKLHASILTLLPRIFPGPLGYSLAGQALAKGIWSLEVINIRDFGLTKHKTIDDVAYGGGDGLVMRADVLGSAIEHTISKYPGSKLYYPSPRGVRLTHNLARKISTENKIIIVCGRFEGIDQRVIEKYNVTEISIGDYILSGGEIAALAILDAVIRLLPDVLKNQNTLQSESFELVGEYNGLLEAPLYTRPAKWQDLAVPEVLLSGHHAKIRNWKKEQSMLITKERRPDLLHTETSHKETID